MERSELVSQLMVMVVVLGEQSREIMDCVDLTRATISVVERYTSPKYESTCARGTDCARCRPFLTRLPGYFGGSTQCEVAS